MVRVEPMVGRTYLERYADIQPQMSFKERKCVACGNIMEYRTPYRYHRAGGIEETCYQEIVKRFGKGIEGSEPAGPRAPDMTLKVKRNGAEGWGGRLGVAWKNTNGSISIQLDPGAVIDWRMSADGYLITLFPKEKL